MLFLSCDAAADIIQRRLQNPDAAVDRVGKPLDGPQSVKELLGAPDALLEIFVKQAGCAASRQAAGIDLNSHQ